MTSPVRSAVVIAAIVAALLFPASALGDANANTDDSNVSTPTASWTYSGVTPTAISAHLRTHGARLTDIESYNVAANTWTVTMVKNSGSYAVPAWWWYVNLSEEQVTQKLDANKGRLIAVHPYTAGRTKKFAVVMVKNSGSQAREWYWGPRASFKQISKHIKSKKTRLTNLEAYSGGGTKRYAFTSVKNSGGDANPWYYWADLTQPALATQVNQVKARLIDIERQPDGTYAGIAVKGSGSDAASSWWYTGLTSLSEVVRLANQLGARVLDIETYMAGGARYYDAILIDSTNTATGRVRNAFTGAFLSPKTGKPLGVFEAYLKQVGGPVKVDLNSSQRAETASALKALHLLHSMRQVQAGVDSLNSPFIYYNYSDGTSHKPSDKCPNPAQETPANKQTDMDFEQGLDEMMSVSDNRTTRGVVLRYGGSFAPLNETASWAGLTSTTLRHNIGCAYGDPVAKDFDVARRNDTSAADLARIYEGVWQGTTLNSMARAEFLESANPSTGVGDATEAMIDAEAAALGKSQRVANEFESLIQQWGKSGGYGTCLPGSPDPCGRYVVIASRGGLIRLPIKYRGAILYRTYSFARFYSDAPLDCDGCPLGEFGYAQAHSKAAVELLREEVRAALATW